MKVVGANGETFHPKWVFQKEPKKKFNVCEHFSNMAKNSTTMLQQFVKTDVLLKNMDAQIGHLINKLQVT
jgi:hypothetical protein